MDHLLPLVPNILRHGSPEGNNLEIVAAAFVATLPGGEAQAWRATSARPG